MTAYSHVDGVLDFASNTKIREKRYRGVHVVIIRIMAGVRYDSVINNEPSIGRCYFAKL